MLIKIKGTKYQKKKNLMAVYRLHLTQFIKMNHMFVGTFFLHLSSDTAQFFMRKFAGIMQHHTSKAVHVLFKALPLPSCALTFAQGFFAKALNVHVMEDMLQCIINRNFLSSEFLVSCLVGTSFINLWPKETLALTHNQSAMHGVRSLLDVLLVHQGNQGILLIYRLLSKILYFYSAYFVYISLWPSLFTGQLSQRLLQKC